MTVIDGEFSTEASVKGVETFIAQGVDGILLHSLDEKVNDQMVKAARKAKIPIVTFYIPTFSRLVPTCRSTRRRPPSRWAGQGAAMKWKEWYPNKPIKIGVIDYLTVEIVQKHRTGPFIAGVLSVDPTAQVVSKLEGSANVQKAMAAMQDMLQAHPEVNLVYGANADHALGALAALENAGRGKAVNGKPPDRDRHRHRRDRRGAGQAVRPLLLLQDHPGPAARVNAKAEMDLLYNIIKRRPARGRVDPDRHLQQVHQLLGHTQIEEAQKFIEDQYFTKVDLKSSASK